MSASETVYEFATSEMGGIIVTMLELAEKTSNFSTVEDALWSDQTYTAMLLCGKGFHIDDIASQQSLPNAWLSRAAWTFSIELAATGMLYQRIKVFTDNLIDYSYKETENFTNITPEWVYKNPHCLPVLMHVAGAFSKQELKKKIGSATDKAISKPASAKISALLKEACSISPPDPSRVRERIKATVEGIVRDLVGRLLLEQFVASALQRNGVPFKREDQYKNLEGVIYDFRADFVVPNETEPLAFLEVRKSSSRHASLYAKDKMFSAINWKGQHQKCLGVLIIDGPWTDVTLKIMSRIFDYVVPIGRADEVAAKIRAYLDGDETVLQWLVNFKIMRIDSSGKVVPAEKVQLRPEELAEVESEDSPE